MNAKTTYGAIGILVVLLAISAYFNFQSKSETSFDENTQQSAETDTLTRVTNLYNQMLPSLPSHDLYCVPSTKSYCNVDGCKNVEANVFVLLGINQSKDSLFMARCDDKPCDIYDVNLLQSGEFTTFETKEPHGILFRTSNLDQSYVEVVTLGTESFVSNGFCSQSKTFTNQ